MTLLFGKPVAERILSETKERIKASGVTPGLAVILVGDDVPSHLYVGLKEKAAREAGIRFEKFLFSAGASFQEVFDHIDGLNHRDDIHGIIVQLPLPEGWPTDEIIARIDPEKDTDGFHQETLKRFLAVQTPPQSSPWKGEEELIPVFPRAIVELVRETGERFHGEKGIVLANSELLGKVMAQALRLEGLEAEYVLSSEAKETIASKTGAARVVVTACGIPGLVTGDTVSGNAIVIDGGIGSVNGKVVGDADRESVEAKAAFLSPVPGGVGPVTVATLLARVTDMTLKEKTAV